MVDTKGIVMGKKQIASGALAFWLIIIGVVMLLAHQFDVEIFFILGFFGILIIAELMAPHYVHPGTLKYIRYLIGAGTIIFGAIVIQNVIKIISGG